MRATVFHGKGDVRVETVPDPKIQEPTDVVARITHACICGSDLWFYRGEAKWEPGWRTGHEWMGIVEEVGSAVTTLKKGDRVIAPFAFSDGTCEFCNKNLQTSCTGGDYWGQANDGGQAEAVRAPLADGTLVKVPDAVANDEGMLKKLLPLTDVMGTGYHAAISADVKPGKTVAVIGDGAVGLCAVLSARKLGAERIVIFGKNPKRVAIAKQFGAGEVVEARGKDGAKAGIAMTNGGFDCVLECVGNEESLKMASKIARPGGIIGFVGVPYGATGLGITRMFSENISLRGGVAPVRAYIPELLEDVMAGRLDPSPVLDLDVDLDGVPQGYASMDDRSAIKVMVRP